MPRIKQTRPRPRGDMIVCLGDLKLRVVEEAKTENRSASNMVKHLVYEAFLARDAKKQAVNQ